MNVPMQTMAMFRTYILFFIIFIHYCFQNVFFDRSTRCTYVYIFLIYLWLVYGVHTQGLVTIHVNILSMHKHVQGRTPFFLTPAHFKSCLFFKFLLIYSKPCLVQLPRPYSIQKISWPPLDYLLWRRSGHFCQEFAWVENSMDSKWK